ncbi:MAG: prephenate dehydrogenase/arogenate dehydrogenase family protein [Lachnospiraceae bacterium]
MESTIGFIGFGLIGGSIAKALKKTNPDITIMAYMRTRQKLEQAKQDGIVDLILNEVDERLSLCDLILLCTPVEYNAQYLEKIRPFLKKGAIISDVGSTKTHIHEEVIRLGLEHCFVGGHPMAGSEKTGYEHATDHLLENAYYIITPTAQSTPEQVERLVQFAASVGAIPMVLDYRKHDMAVATISHLPHIIASSLVNLVKDQDDENQVMKQVAAGGFKDITRIASASPEMWEQICSSNSENISLVLESYIQSLESILAFVRRKDQTAIYQLFDTSRTYRNSISERATGPIQPEYAFTMDIADEIGAISTISVILAAKGISIKNIGINHNREHGEGALGIAFYDEASMKSAWEQLEKYHYELISIH